jgi:hypothetical protein
LDCHYFLAKFGTQKLSRRKQQDRTKKKNQYPSRVCFRNHRNVLVPTVFSLAVVTFIVLLALVAFSVIVVGKSQRRELRWWPAKHRLGGRGSVVANKSLWLKRNIF